MSSATLTAATVTSWADRGRHYGCEDGIAMQAQRSAARRFAFAGAALITQVLNSLVRSMPIWTPSPRRRYLRPLRLTGSSL